MAKAHLIVWEQGRPIHRIHPVIFGSSQFNDSGKGYARFSPLIKADGTIIPTLYGAGAFRASAMETIFHDLPDDISNFIFSYKTLQLMAHSVVAPARDLTLLDLGSVGLRALQLKKSNVIDSQPSTYPHTQALALAWHQELPHIDGLSWISRLDDHSPACMLFGDRVTPADLPVQAPVQSLAASPCLEAVVELAKILGITKGRHIPSGLIGF